MYLYIYIYIYDQTSPFLPSLSLSPFYLSCSPPSSSSPTFPKSTTGNSFRLQRAMRKALDGQRLMVACLGESVTVGNGIDGRTKHAWPAWLDKILGMSLPARGAQHKVYM